MRVLLRLSQPKLRPPLLGHPFPQSVHDGPLRKGRRHISVMRVGIFHHSQQGRPCRPHPHVKGIKPRLTDGRQNLPRPVRPEIQAEQPVAIPRAPIPADHRGGEEFIRLPLGIRGCHRGHPIRRPLPLTPHHRGIGAAHPFPTVVAVHRPIAPDHRRHPRPHRQFRLQRCDKPVRRRRRHIPPIRDRMQPDRHPQRGDRTARRQHMHDMPMHPAIRHDTHQMRRPARRLHLARKFHQRRIGRKGPILHRQINRAKVHRHHASRADIGMPHLGIAHLPRGQPHIRPVGDQPGFRAGRPKPVEIWHIRLRRRIALAAFGKPPAVKDAQHDRLRNAHGR